MINGFLVSDSGIIFTNRRFGSRPFASEKSARAQERGTEREEEENFAKKREGKFSFTKTSDSTRDEDQASEKRNKATGKEGALLVAGGARR